MNSHQGSCPMAYTYTSEGLKILTRFIPFSQSEPDNLLDWSFSCDISSNISGPYNHESGAPSHSIPRKITFTEPICSRTRSYNFASITLESAMNINEKPSICTW